MYTTASFGCIRSPHLHNAAAIIMSCLAILYVRMACSILRSPNFAGLLADCLSLLQIGEEILVTATHVSGQWEGRLKNGAEGYFPFTYIQFIEEGGSQD